jgi:hypothetical protein
VQRAKDQFTTALWAPLVKSLEDVTARALTLVAPIALAALERDVFHLLGIAHGHPRNKKEERRN